MPRFVGTPHDMDFLARQNWTQVEIRGRENVGEFVAVSDNEKLLTLLSVALLLQKQIIVEYEEGPDSVNRLTSATIEELSYNRGYIKTLAFDSDIGQFSAEVYQLGRQESIKLFTTDSKAQSVLEAVALASTVGPMTKNPILVDTEPREGGEITRVHLNIASVERVFRQQQLRVSAATDTTWYASCETGHPFWNGPDEITFSDAQKDAAAHDRALHNGVPTAVVLNELVRGGGGNITQIGMGGRVSLGSSSVGTTETFSIRGNATVQFDMFMPFATVPCGSWTFGGPGSFNQLLGGNIFGCDPQIGESCTLTAFAQSGSVPVWVTANP